MEAFAPRAAAAVSLAAAGVAAALWQVMRPTAEQKHMERQQVLIDAAIRELQNWSSGSEWRLRHQHHAVPGDEAPSTPVRGNRGGSAGSQLVALTAEDEEEAVDLIARAFTGSDASERPELGLDWVMGPAVRGQWEGLRYDAVRHNLRWCFLFTVGGAGVALGVRLPDGTLGAVCLAHPYIGDNGGRGGPPAVYPDIGPGPIDRGELGDWARKRAEWFYGGKGNLLDRLHGECAPGPHWYVQIMAVDPAQQGKGLCGRALRAISFLADKAGVPCFLDTCGKLSLQPILEPSGLHSSQDGSDTVVDRGAEPRHLQPPRLRDQPRVRAQRPGRSGADPRPGAAQASAGHGHDGQGATRGGVRRHHPPLWDGAAAQVGGRDEGGGADRLGLAEPVVSGMYLSDCIHSHGHGSTPPDFISAAERISSSSRAGVAVHSCQFNWW
eukprot:COSAG04_NODE_452_length_14117_cov_2.295834_2_plen_439_part_00